MTEVNRYHNIIRSLGDWDKLSADFEAMRERRLLAQYQGPISRRNDRVTVSCTVCPALPDRSV